MLHDMHRLKYHRGVYWCTTCGLIAQHAAGKKSRAIGLVLECPGFSFRTLSPKASVDWPLARESVPTPASSSRAQVISSMVKMCQVIRVFPCLCCWFDGSRSIFRNCGKQSLVGKVLWCAPSHLLLFLARRCIQRYTMHWMWCNLHKLTM